MRISLLGVVVLLCVGCASLSPNNDVFYQALQSTCQPASITLPAPNGGVYTIPINTGNGDACKQGMQTAFLMSQSGWERFGTAAVNMVGNVGMTAAPWFAAGYIAHEGYKQAGDNNNGSFNSDSSNHSDNSNRSTNNPNNSTNNSHNPQDNSDNSNNSDNRHDYDNPVAVIPPVVVTNPVPEVTQ